MESLTWGDILSGDFSMRFSPEGFFFSDVGNSLFIRDRGLEMYALAFCNTNLFNIISKMLNQTMHFKPGNMLKVPFLVSKEKESEIYQYVIENIDRSKLDWDSFEVSWDFKFHPFISMNKKSIDVDGTYITKVTESFSLWKAYMDISFQKLKHNEEELNRIFIDIYGLQDELAPEVDDKDVTVRKADLGRDVRSFISYAVGCMFGRYSLDQEGLMFAGGDIKDIYAYYGGTFADTNIRLDGKYKFGEFETSFYYLPVDGKEPLECWKVDADNIIPITDEEYFADDIVKDRKSVV